MTRVRLELNRLRIERPKERWKLYFVVLAEHPEDSAKMLLTVLPQDPTIVVPSNNNTVDFEGNGIGADGLLVLSRPMPNNRELNVHFYVRHSRRNLRKAGEYLGELETLLGNQVIETVSGILGSTTPWLVVTLGVKNILAKLFKEMPDRDMGFISMYEAFGPEFEHDEELDREKTGGHISLVYTWSVDRSPEFSSPMNTTT